VALTPPLDPERFRSRFAALLEALSDIGGVEPVVLALANKSRLFREALGPETIGELDLDALEILLDTVMPARRRLAPALTAMDRGKRNEALRELLYGQAPLAGRVETFAGALAAHGADADARAQRRFKRGALDFAAELLHFRDPVRYPLMTRWVWDAETQSGALRELIKGGDTVKDIPWGGPGVYEAGRAWVARQMAEAGVYREPHFLVDLFLAHAYAGYMLSMSAGMGLLKADFGGSSDPLEIAKKLLGVDESRIKSSRVKKAVNGNS
jgi:hypothetical protein